MMIKQDEVRRAPQARKRRGMRGLIGALVALVTMLCALVVPGVAHAATSFVVTTTDGSSDTTTCPTSGQPGYTLACALHDLGVDPGNITFHIDLSSDSGCNQAAGICTIRLASGQVHLNESQSINGGYTTNGSNSIVLDHTIIVVNTHGSGRSASVSNIAVVHGGISTYGYDITINHVDVGVLPDGTAVGGSGISFGDGGNLLSDSHIAYSSGYGVFGDYSQETIHGNTIDHNANGGVSVQYGRNTIVGNTIEQNQGNGITIQSGCDNTVRGNTIDGNTGAGVALRGEVDDCDGGLRGPSTITNNTISNNGGPAILDAQTLYSTGAPYTGNITSPNTEFNNAAVAARGTTVSPTEGATFSGALASFTDSDGNTQSSAYAVTIIWGDGSSSAGTVTASGSTFTVSGSHSYAEEGTSPIRVHVADTDGNTADANSSAIITDAALTATGTTAKLTGKRFSGTVTSFTDADPNGTVADYTATITWGDGSNSTGTIMASGGSFIVSGDHAYPKHTSYAASVTITDNGGSTATAQVMVGKDQDNGNGGGNGDTSPNATPELGSGELLATGLLPIGAILLYRRRRSSKKTAV